MSHYKCSRHFSTWTFMRNKNEVCSFKTSLKLDMQLVIKLTLSFSCKNKKKYEHSAANNEINGDNRLIPPATSHNVHLSCHIDFYFMPLASPVLPRLLDFWHRSGEIYVILCYLFYCFSIDYSLLQVWTDCKGQVHHILYKIVRKLRMFKFLPLAKQPWYFVHCRCSVLSHRDASFKRNV